MTANQPTFSAFHLPPEPTNTFMVDIETGGLAYGSAILEIAAAEFNPATGEILRSWSTHIDPLDSARHGLTHDQETAAFHRKNGYSLRPGIDLFRALNTLDTFLHLHREDITVWAWGLDFETLHFKAATAAINHPMPWKYWEGRCARTAWQLAFPGIKPPRRPHTAAEDVALQIADLCGALSRLQPA
jgi:hypothetical protein